MADAKEFFATTVDGSGDGSAIDKREEGAAEGDAQSHAILSVKDENNNLQYLPMKNGKILVDEADPGTFSDVEATIAGTGARTEVVALTLTILKVYTCINYCVSTTKTALFEIVQLDDAAETVLKKVIVGAGQYSLNDLLGNGKKEVTAGGSGTQEIKIFSTAIAGNTDHHGYVSALEKP